MPDSQAALDLLPPELIATIADQLEDKADLLPLHSVCKSVSNASMPAYVKAFFTERSHLLTRQALQDLVEITSSRVGKKISSIAFVARSLQDLKYSPNSIFELEPNWSDNGYDDYCKNEEQLRAEGHDSYMRETIWSKWLSELEVVKRDACSLFLQAFKNMARANLTPNIRLTTDAPSSIYGLRDVSRLLCAPERLNVFDLEERWDYDYDGIGRSLLTALAGSQMRVEQLTLYATSGTFGPSTFQIDSPSIPDSLYVCSSTLRSFDMSFNEDVYQTFAEPEWEAFSRFAGAALNLEALKLNFDFDYDAEPNPMFGYVADLFEGARLKKIRIGYAWMMGDDIQRVLDTHCATLRSLEMDGCGLYPPDRWIHVARWMAEHLELEHLSMSEVRGRHALDLWYQVHGEKEVKETLKHMAYSLRASSTACEDTNRPEENVTA